MSLEKLRQKRLKWVEANRENGFDDGIRRLLTDLYPDNAHFIYELLQNAEDAGATEVRFILRENSVEFEHNGARLFTLEDVDSITSIGFSTKREDHTSIGKFGVGFKAVFAYTETPEVVSGEYHFRIRDLVVPDTEELAFCPRGEKQTYFSFPFDNDAKPPEKARDEIERNLQKLDESTLLFLSNIKKIEYRLPDSTEGFIERRETDQENRIEILVQRLGYSEPDSVSFLRFEKEVEINDEDGAPKLCRIAIAFLLDREQEQAARRSTKRQERSQSVQRRIKSLEPGQVSIYFPAEKETSNLRFHLHSPFASTVARDSIRDCPENDELRDHLADLIAESMAAIREQGLLTVEFLATLPNDQESLPSFYKPIMERLVEVFKKEKLFPMKQGGHAPASGIYRGSRQLSELIGDEDLATILRKDSSLPLWAANAPQRNQEANNFLSSLGISKWDEKDLIRELSEQPDLVKTWLKDKPDEWHQEFYALLGDFLSNQSMYTDDLSNLSIVRISDGTTYKKGKDCYFPSDDVEHDEKFPRVAKGVYSSEKNKDQQKKAREFLEDIDVSEVEESDRVEAILKQRYGKGSICGQHHEQDIKRFIALIEKQPSRTLLFKNYFIFKIDKNLDNKTWWAKPSIVFLDSPYRDTGLGAYYDALGEDSDRKWALSPEYEKYGIDPERLGKFAKAMGAQTKLEVKQQEIPRNHPEYSDLKSAPGERLSNVINIDHTIPEFKVLLDKPNLDKARLIWRTMDSLDDDYLESKYRKNATGGFHYGASSFVHDLRRAAWVPQKYRGEPLRFVHPCDASSDYLPEGFSYESWREWIRKIEFGKSWQDQEEQERRRKERATQEYQRKEEVAIEMGFDSAEEAEELAMLKKKDPEAFKEFIQKKKAKEQRPTFPEKTSNNPDRRQEKVKEQLADTSDKEYEELKRSVRTSRGAVVPKIDLREQYTNDSGEMVCQICQEEMPFKKRDGKYYFEAVEALSKDYFPKEYEAQSIALCPLCAARYKEFVIRDEDAMKELHRALKDSDDLGVPLKLGELETSIRFVETHRQDMQTILQNRA